MLWLARTECHPILKRKAYERQKATERTADEQDSNNKKPKESKNRNEELCKPNPKKL